jgi:hypothetical protein
MAVKTTRFDPAEYLDRDEFHRVLAERSAGDTRRAPGGPCIFPCPDNVRFAI